MEKKFQRTIEDFKCENCGAQVRGDGYTNHCPRCLWSKHVDINPGDRQNGCQGLMEPMGVFFKKGEWYLRQKCTRCDHETNIRTSKQDNKNIIIDLIKKSAKL